MILLHQNQNQNQNQNQKPKTKNKKDKSSTLVSRKEKSTYTFRPPSSRRWLGCLLVAFSTLIIPTGMLSIDDTKKTIYLVGAGAVAAAAAYTRYPALTSDNISHGPS
jgi:hypothetical protein